MSTDMNITNVFFQIVPILFMIVFCLSLLTSLVSVVKMGLQWNKNNHSPKLTVGATVIAMRTNVARRASVRVGNSRGPHHSRSSTTYYATFQVDTGDRMELQMTGYEYGMLTEGDRGRLTFQGTRYLGFERES